MNLTIEKLTKSFGEKQALNIDHYAIHSGETIGLVGNNGAGKTTLFRIILDLLHADTGCVTIDGVVDGQPVSCDTSKSEAWKAYTGAFVDTGFLIDYLTPEEYFRFIAKISGISDAVLHDRLLQFDGFMNGEILGQKTLIRNLSMGNKQKVGIIWCHAALSQIADTRRTVQFPRPHLSVGDEVPAGDLQQGASCHHHRVVPQPDSYPRHLFTYHTPRTWHHPQGL